MDRRTPTPVSRRIRLKGGHANVEVYFDPNARQYWLGDIDVELDSGEAYPSITEGGIFGSEEEALETARRAAQGLLDQG